MNKSKMLSKEFKVACAILDFNEKKEKVWFTKLRDYLKETVGMSQSTLMSALETLFDWGIVKAEYGETAKGRAARLLYVAGESKATIRQLHEEYWKPDHG